MGLQKMSDEIARLSNDNRLLISHELHAEIENLTLEVGMLDVVFFKWRQLDTATKYDLQRLDNQHANIGQQASILSRDFQKVHDLLKAEMQNFSNGDSGGTVLILSPRSKAPAWEREETTEFPPDTICITSRLSLIDQSLLLIPSRSVQYVVAEGPTYRIGMEEIIRSPMIRAVRRLGIEQDIAINRELEASLWDF